MQIGINRQNEFLGRYIDEARLRGLILSQGNRVGSSPPPITFSKVNVMTGTSWVLQALLLVCPLPKMSRT